MKLPTKGEAENQKVENQKKIELFIDFLELYKSIWMFPKMVVSQNGFGGKNTKFLGNTMKHPFGSARLTSFCHGFISSLHHSGPQGLLATTCRRRSRINRNLRVSKTLVTTRGQFTKFHHSALQIFTVFEKIWFQLLKKTLKSQNLNKFDNTFLFIKNLLVGSVVPAMLMLCKQSLIVSCCAPGRCAQSTGTKPSPVRFP